ncbi:MAG: DUF433 domain-containing protein [Chloroflexi bacterium]|nr:DUF433 domain-containing protein [Chloroflexota bacterium]
MAIGDEQLIARWIEPHPRRPEPARARVKGYATPVWALVAHWRAIGKELDQVARDYDLPQEAVAAAFAYYRQHQDAIDARIAAHEAFFAA